MAALKSDVTSAVLNGPFPRDVTRRRSPYIIPRIPSGGQRVIGNVLLSVHNNCILPQLVHMRGIT